MTIVEFVKENIDQNSHSLPFKTHIRSLEKGKVITDYGQIETSVYFVQSGILTTSIRYREEDRILDFHFEGAFCGAYTSLLSKEPSDIRVTCYTACQVEIVDYAELQEVYRSSLLANQIGRVATEKLFFDRVTREKELLTLTAEERYQSLMDKNPILVQKIAVKDLAKYLGVRPESLSRIRKS